MTEDAPARRPGNFEILREWIVAAGISRHYNEFGLLRRTLGWNGTIESSWTPAS